MKRKSMNKNFLYANFIVVFILRALVHDEPASFDLTIYLTNFYKYLHFACTP